jgi:hypothetical protein
MNQIFCKVTTVYLANNGLTIKLATLLQNIYLCQFMKVKLNWDVMGAAASIICAIHCALLPVVLTSLPVFGVDVIHNVYFEWGMIFLAFVVGVYSLVHGFTKHHHTYLPLLIFAAGMLFLVLKQLLPTYEYIFLGIAVSLILFAHYSNYKLCHKSKCDSPHHKH